MFRKGLSLRGGPCGVLVCMSMHTNMFVCLVVGFTYFCLFQSSLSACDANDSQSVVTVDCQLKLFAVATGTGLPIQKYIITQVSVAPWIECVTHDVSRIRHNNVQGISFSRALRVVVCI